MNMVHFGMDLFAVGLWGCISQDTIEFSKWKAVVRFEFEIQCKIRFNLLNKIISY